MDRYRFDTLTKSLSSTRSRRGVLGGVGVGVAGVVAGALGARSVAAAPKERARRWGVVCARQCRQEFPEAKKGVRRRCVRACVKEAKAAQ